MAATDEPVQIPPAPKAVAAGAKRLDSKRPGWAADVNVDTLDLRDSLRCVLGQLYGSYAEGASVRGIDLPFSDQLAVHGFMATRNALTDLESEWRKQIAHRQS